MLKPIYKNVQKWKINVYKNWMIFYKIIDCLRQTTILINYFDINYKWNSKNAISNLTLGMLNRKENIICIKIKY